MTRNHLYLILSLAATATLTACNKNLNREPANTNTANIQYSTATGYKQVLAKVYGSYALISSQGTGASDINVTGISDVGETDFIRLLFNMQELTTDNDVCAWNDTYLQPLHNLNIVSNNVYIAAMYDRSFFQITVANDFIRQSTDAAVAARGITGADAANIKHYRAEARFLRAYQYYILMDLFGNPAFVTENDPVGDYIPKQIKRADLFKYIESELLGADSNLVAPRQNEYARADQAALADALQQVRNGTKISDAFQQGGLANPISYRLLTVAEKTGGLGPVLDRIAAFQEAQVSRTIDLISRLIEPAMMIFIGVVIGGIVVLMYMPIFEIASSIQ